MVTSLIRRRATRTASILALGLAFGSAQAAIVSYDASTVSFQSSDQSLWGSGDAPQLDVQQFVGTSWNESNGFRRDFRQRAHPGHRYRRYRP